MTVVTNTNSPSANVEVRVTGIWLVIVISSVLKCVMRDAVVGCVVVCDRMLRLVDVMVDSGGSVVLLLLSVLVGGGLDAVVVVTGTTEPLVVV